MNFSTFEEHTSALTLIHVMNSGVIIAKPESIVFLCNDGILQFILSLPCLPVPLLSTRCFPVLMTSAITYFNIIFHYFMTSCSSIPPCFPSTYGDVKHLSYRLGCCSSSQTCSPGLSGILSASSSQRFGLFQCGSCSFLPGCGY